MNKRFLNAKHWQLFLLMLGIPLIFQIVFMVSIVTSVANNSDSQSTIILNFLPIFPLFILLFIGVFFGWFWAIAIGLQPWVPEEVSMKINRFKIFFFIPLVYIMSTVLLITSSFNGFLDDGSLPATLFSLVVPLHLFSMFCIFHSLYFVAKTLKTVELQRKVTFSDFAGEFFMIWFFPIGIWIIQPRVNQIVAE